MSRLTPQFIRFIGQTPTLQEGAFSPVFRLAAFYLAIPLEPPFYTLQEQRARPALALSLFHSDSPLVQHALALARAKAPCATGARQRTVTADAATL
jgi:hypothetical protein